MPCAEQTFKFVVVQVIMLTAVLVIVLVVVKILVAVKILVVVVAEVVMMATAALITIHDCGGLTAVLVGFAPANSLARASRTRTISQLTCHVSTL